VGESLPAAGTGDLWPIADAGDLRPDTGVDDLCSVLAAGVTISVAGASLLSPSAIVEPSTPAPSLGRRGTRARHHLEVIRL